MARQAKAVRKSKRLMEPVRDLGDLRQRCYRGEAAYQKLAVIAADNLAALGGKRDWKSALLALDQMAGSLEYEYGDADPEATVVDEVNFVRDLVEG